MNVAVVLPAYNEARALPGLLDSLGGLRGYFASLRLVVVDDGSGDGTAETAAEHGAGVVRHSRNRGLGAALMTGLREACGADVVVTMDADGTAGSDVALALALAVVGGADLAVASRYVRGARVGGIPVARRVLSQAGSLLARVVLALPVRDCTSGFRAYSGRVVREALACWDGRLVTCRGPACQLELLRKCLPFARRVEEVPLVLDYSRRGRSRLRVGRGVVEALGYLARCAVRAGEPVLGGRRDFRAEAK